MKVEIIDDYESRAGAPEEEPLQPEVNRPFHFEDSQVVLQVRRSITGFPSTLLTISLIHMHRWKDRSTKSIVIS
jgi:hypothetical protein